MRCLSTTEKGPDREIRDKMPRSYHNACNFSLVFAITYIGSRRCWNKEQSLAATLRLQSPSLEASQLSEV